MVERRFTERERIEKPRKEREEKLHERYARLEERRIEFCNTVDKIVPELKKEIKEKNTISMTMEELSEKIGLSPLSRLSEIGLYWRTKDCLFDKGIFVSTKRDHELTLLMRSRTPKDKLPISLEQHRERVKKILGR